MPIRSSLRLFRYVFLEAIPFIVLVLLILTTLILAQQIARQSELLFSSTASVFLSLRVIFSLLPGVIVITLPFSLLIGSLLALNRLSADSEIVAAQATGISILQFSFPLLLCGLFGVGVSAYLTLTVIPSVISEANLIRKDLLLRALTAPIKPQTFNTYFPNYLLYIRTIEKETGNWQGVFIVRKNPTTESNWLVLTAKQARLRMTQTSPITLELDLLDGALITISDKMPEKQALVRFSQQEIKLSSATSTATQISERTSPELSFLQLLDRGKKAETLLERRQAQVESHKRLSLPLACFVLILLAIPLGVQTTRQSGRAFAFTIGFCLAILYYLVLLAGQNFALSGALPVWLGIWLPNLMGLVGAASLNYSPAHIFSKGSRKPITRQPQHLPQAKTLIKTVLMRTTSVLSIRFSRFSLFSGLINYLLLSEVIKYLCLSAAVLLLTSLIFTLFDLVPSLSRSNLGWRYAATYLLYLSPQILYYIAPFALLLAILIAYGTLSRSNQITALLIGGQSNLRLSLPFLLGATLIIAGLFLLSEKVLPLTNREQDARYNIIKGKKLEQSVAALGQYWAQGEDGTIYAYHYTNQSNILLNTTAYRLNAETGVLQEVIQADETAAIDHRSWEILRGWQMRIRSDNQIDFLPIESSQPYRLIVPDTNVIFTRVVNEAAKMGFYELRQYIYYLSRLNAPTTTLRVDLEKKIAFPFSCLPLLAIAFPLALTNTKRKTLAGIGISIIIGFTYWISASIFESLGRQAFLPPGLSVWGPQALFTALGIFLSFRLRK